MAKKLSARHEAFCQDFKVTLNATQSYKNVYGCTSEVANTNGPALLVKTGVQERIDQLTLERNKKREIKSEQILDELERLGYSDVRALYAEDGTIKHPSEWPDDLARAVSSIEVDEIIEDMGFKNTCENCKRKFSKDLVGFTKKIKLWNKPQSLEMLGRHKKLFTDKIEVIDKTGLASKLAAARRRREAKK